jgi:hypothetical protein
MASKTLDALQPHECRYPLNTPAPHERYLFCAEPTWDAGTPYCQHHHKLCTVVIPVRKSRAPTQIAGVHDGIPLLAR